MLTCPCALPGGSCAVVGHTPDRGTASPDAALVPFTTRCCKQTVTAGSSRSWPPPQRIPVSQSMSARIVVPGATTTWACEQRGSAASVSTATAYSPGGTSRATRSRGLAQPGRACPCSGVAPIWRMAWSKRPLAAALSDDATESHLCMRMGLVLLVQCHAVGANNRRPRQAS